MQSFLSCPLRTLHQQFESYKQEVRRIGAETRRQQTQQKDDAPTCGICRKTKFADGCGHLCSYCQTKFCARCGGRVSLRSNNVRKLTFPLFPFHSHLIPAVVVAQFSPSASVFLLMSAFFGFLVTLWFYQSVFGTSHSPFKAHVKLEAVLCEALKLTWMWKSITASVLSCVSCNYTAAIKQAWQALLGALLKQHI